MSEVPLQRGAREARERIMKMKTAVVACTEREIVHLRMCGASELLNCTYRGTSLIRNRPTLAPYSRVMSRALWWS